MLVAQVEARLRRDVTEVGSSAAISPTAKIAPSPHRRLQVTIVDLHNLPDRAQRFVVGVTLRGEFAKKERQGRARPLMFVMLAPARVESEFVLNLSYRLLGAAGTPITSVIVSAPRKSSGFAV